MNRCGRKDKGKTGLDSVRLYFHHVPRIIVHSEENKNSTGISTGGIYYILEISYNRVRRARVARREKERFLNGQYLQLAAIPGYWRRENGVTCRRVSTRMELG